MSISIGNGFDAVGFNRPGSVRHWMVSQSCVVTRDDAAIGHFEGSRFNCAPSGGADTNRKAGLLAPGSMPQSSLPGRWPSGTLGGAPRSQWRARAGLAPASRFSPWSRTCNPRPRGTLRLGWEVSRFQLWCLLRLASEHLLEAPLVLCRSHAGCGSWFRAAQWACSYSIGGTIRRDSWRRRLLKSAPMTGSPTRDRRRSSTARRGGRIRLCRGR